MGVKGLTENNIKNNAMQCSCRIIRLFCCFLVVRLRTRYINSEVWGYMEVWPILKPLWPLLLTQHEDKLEKYGSLLAH